MLLLLEGYCRNCCFAVVVGAVTVRTEGAGPIDGRPGLNGQQCQG